MRSFIVLLSLLSLVLACEPQEEKEEEKKEEGPSGPCRPLGEGTELCCPDGTKVQYRFQGYRV